MSLENNFEEQASQAPVETNKYSETYQDFFNGIKLGEGKINAGELERSYTEGEISEIEFGKLAFELLKKVEEQAKEALVDNLTKLNNLRGFNEKLNEAVEELRSPEHQREHPLQSIMVIFLDMNGLGSFNNEYGHKAGDQSLIALADRLKKSVREKDIIAHKSGDEFLVFMPIDSTQENVHQNIFDGFFAKINDELSIDIQDSNDQTINRTILTAAGFSVLDKSNTETTAEELIHEADLAMYSIKDKMKKEDEIKKAL